MIRDVTGNETRFSTGPIIEALKNELGPLFLMRAGVSQSDRDKRDKRLASIAEFATEADWLMHLGRTDFAVIWNHPGSNATSGFPFEGGGRPDGFKMEANSEAHPGAPLGGDEASSRGDDAGEGNAGRTIAGWRMTGERWAGRVAVV